MYHYPFFENGDSRIITSLDTPYGNQKLEVSRAQMCFDGMKIVDEARKEPEEGFLLKGWPLLLMQVGQHEYEN